MLKIEQKKKQAKVKKSKQNENIKQLKDALSVPGAIDSPEYALELYDKQGLKASSPSQKDL